MAEAAAALSDLTGKTVTYQPIPIAAVRQNSEDFAKMLEWFDAGGYTADIPSLMSKWGIRPRRSSSGCAARKRSRRRPRSERADVDEGRIACRCDGDAGRAPLRADLIFDRGDVARQVSWKRPSRAPGSAVVPCTTDADVVLLGGAGNRPRLPIAGGRGR